MSLSTSSKHLRRRISMNQSRTSTYFLSALGNTHNPAVERTCAKSRAGCSLPRMRKVLLYTLYVISAVFACVAIIGSLIWGSPWAAIFWIFMFSPILINALREPQAGSKQQEEMPKDIQPPVADTMPLRQPEQGIPLDDHAMSSATLFKRIGHFFMGLTAVIGVLLLFLGPISGLILVYPLGGALLCYFLSAALR